MVFDQPAFGKQVLLKGLFFGHHKLVTRFSPFIIKKGGVLEKCPLTIFTVCLTGMSPSPDEKKTPLCKLMHAVGYPAGGTVDTAVDECVQNA